MTQIAFSQAEKPGGKIAVSSSKNNLASIPGHASR
jgi:hypothetical protein